MKKVVVWVCVVLLSVFCLRDGFVYGSSKAALEERMKGAGFVNVQALDSSIRVDLKYSSRDNFMKTDVYGDYDKLYLEKRAAGMLVKAQKYLHSLKPDYSLLVYDAARPLSVQYKMWSVVKGTKLQNYVSNPAKGSMHNYGTAVDLTVVDGKGKALDMGTPFDFLGSLAQPKLEAAFLKSGKLTKNQISNRRLLRTVMTKTGFRIINTEWWHFNAFPQKWVRQNLKILK